MPAATFHLGVSVHPMPRAPVTTSKSTLQGVLFLSFFLFPFFLPHLDIAVQLWRDVEAPQGAATNEVQHKPVGTGG